MTLTNWMHRRPDDGLLQLLLVTPPRALLEASARDTWTTVRRDAPCREIVLLLGMRIPPGHGVRPVVVRQVLACHLEEAGTCRMASWLAAQPTPPR